MKINQISVIAAVSIAALLAGSSVVSAQDNKEGKEGRKGRGPSVEQRLDRLTTELKLTDEQKPKVKSVLEESQKKRQEFGDLDREQRREKERDLMAAQDKKLKEIFTPEQFQKYQDMRQQFRGGRRSDGEKKAEK